MFPAHLTMNLPKSIGDLNKQGHYAKKLSLEAFLKDASNAIGEMIGAIPGETGYSFQGKGPFPSTGEAGAAPMANPKAQPLPSETDDETDDEGLQEQMMK